MRRVGYIACSSYSGSTLIAFMLNTHPDIVSIGHTTGWKFGKDEEYYCSCGQVLQACPFFCLVKEAFKERGLPFDVRNFGVDYRLSDSPRLNRYLTAGSRFSRSSTIEKLRDRIVESIPKYKSTLAQHDRANLTLIDVALSYSGAKVFADGAQDPYRLRRLTRIPDIDLAIIHLVRDVRGIAFSNIEMHGSNAEAATHMWLRQQEDIIRITKEFPRRMIVHYEDLCGEPDETLNRIYTFLGLPPSRYSGEFKNGQHHVLGNVMRLGGSRIIADVRWKDGLSREMIDSVMRICGKFIKKHQDRQMKEIVGRYMEAT